MSSIIHKLLDTAGCFGDRIAIDDFESVITYNELVEKSFSVAAGIEAALRGGKRQQPVIVYLPKSIDAVVSFMGVLCTSNPYVPVQDTIPIGRLITIVDTLCPRMIITDAEGKRRLRDASVSTDVYLYTELVSAKADEDMILKSLSDTIDLDPAYIMYTSGSTGVPKGVTISHRGIMDYAAWLTKEFHIDEHSVLGLQSGFHFDNSVFDIYGSFLKGAKLVIIPDALFMYPEKLLLYIQEKEVSCIFWVPTVMISVANSGALEKILLPSLKTVVFAGEVMPNKQLNMWRKALPGCLYANLYGPTEITVDCTYYIVDREFADSDPLPIGKACPNMRVFLLNEDNEIITEPNERGEICVGGSGVGLGYWNNEEAAKKVFVQNPCNKSYHEMIYRTGDIGYYSEDNLIMFAGRKDSQIKYRGNRIELGEIETAAMTVRGVENACVLFDEEKQEIAAFIESSENISLRYINGELRYNLPTYMLPKRLVVMGKLPHTPNGKIDRVRIKKEYL